MGWIAYHDPVTGTVTEVLGEPEMMRHLQDFLGATKQGRKKDREELANNPFNPEAS